MFGISGIRLASTPRTTSTIASGTSSRLATARPMITTTAIATASVKRSCSPMRSPRQRSGGRRRRLGPVGGPADGLLPGLAVALVPGVDDRLLAIARAAAVHLEQRGRLDQVAQLGVAIVAGVEIRAL